MLCHWIEKWRCRGGEERRVAPLRMDKESLERQPEENQFSLATTWPWKRPFPRNPNSLSFLPAFSWCLLMFSRQKWMITFSQRIEEKLEFSFLLLMLENEPLWFPPRHPRTTAGGVGGGVRRARENLKWNQSGIVYSFFWLRVASCAGADTRRAVLKSPP